jgi:hypothetical protein
MSMTDRKSLWSTRLLENSLPDRRSEIPGTGSKKPSGFFIRTNMLLPAVINFIMFKYSGQIMTTISFISKNIATIHHVEQ